ncbi:MAG: hypothetical protein IJS81_01505 [Selenomonadaceae bacterium]|nr:hypothetical protein [Selenomonadaceae bacterium]
MNGGRHDSGVWIDGDEENFVYAGAGNDSITIFSRGAKLYGESDNDIITINRDYTFADGGDGNDVIHIFGGGSNPVDNITITGGNGNDTVQIEPRYNKNVGVVVTDFSNDDTFRLDDIYFGISSRNLTQDNSSGNVIIRDTSENQPLNMTLAGVSDISQVADAKYIRYYEGTPYGSSTFGELFGVSSSSTPSSSTTTPTSTTSTTPTTLSGGDTIINNNYYGDVYIINVYGGVYVYNGGNKVINNYQQGEVVRLDSDYAGIDLNGNSFFVRSSSGAVEIQNSRDKFIGYGAGSDEVAVYSYVAGGGGAIDGRDKSQVEMMIGAENSDNQIYAGDGGSSVWGGVGGNDSLVGGAGYDEFFYAIGSGNDTISNAGDNDVVNLAGVTLEQITYAEVNQSEISIGFNDGGNLKLQGQAATGFALEGVTYTADRSTSGWRVKN